MENNRGILSHFGGIIRLVIFIILLALITFFIVRWIRNRGETNRAQEASQGAVSDTADESVDQDTSKNTTKDDSSKPVGTQIPSGIADSGSGASTTTQTVPEAGIGTNVLITTVLLSLITYLGTKNFAFGRQASKRL